VRVLVTGATGTVGRHVVASLADRDAVLRAGCRTPDSEALSAVDESVALDFEKPETWGPALADVDALFLVRPPAVAAERVGEFAVAAGRVGVERVAYLSTLGAERNPLIPHHRIEKRVAASGVAYTHLRASFFCQNLLEVHRPEIVEREEVFVPAGDGATSFVDARDLGAAAATVLTETGHANCAYDLTGPAALDYHEVAAVFSDVLGRDIRYANPSVPEFVVRMRRRGEPWGFVAVMVAIYTTARLGLAGHVTDDLYHLLGRPPRELRTFVEDYAAEFRPSAETETGDPDASPGGPP
jgi:uncharacterized protein YbjT (DUF2867 family)